MSYQEFIRNNRIRMNKTMNRIIWVCLIAEPILCFGNLIGLWSGITYTSLVVLFCMNLIIALFSSIITSKWPDTMFASILGFVVIDMVLVYLASNRLGIYMMFFFVPLLSLLFVNQNLYIFACAWSYIMMFYSAYNRADYYVSVREDFTDPIVWFISYISGCTIEMFVMFITGIMICRFMQRYLMEKYDDELRLQKQIRMINSMNSIYELILIIDYKENRLTKIIDNCQEDYDIESLDDVMWDISGSIADDDERLFRIFTNIHSLKGRLRGRNILTAEFKDVNKGWMRGRFISVKNDESGNPETIIFTLHDIDEEKKEIEAFERESKKERHVDFYNMKSLREKIFEEYANDSSDNLAVFVIELNELKMVNSKYGIDYGDLYIDDVKKAIDNAFENKGNIYRVGGDQYVGVLKNDESAHDVADRIRKYCTNREGNDNMEIPVSVGYASKREHPGLDISQLATIADEILYTEKVKYYANPKHDRRKNREVS